MTQSLHPTTLFHFTNKAALYSILNWNFRISYAREKIVGPSSTRRFAVPMVSFCDIKMSDLKYFIERDYGRFGIGLTKDWANRNSLNPVMYVNKYCDITDRFNEGLNSVYQALSKEKALYKGYNNLMNTYRYMKNYEGRLERASGAMDNYRFADEREWRYVPPFETKGVEPIVPDSRIKTHEAKEIYNRKVEDVKLFFEPDDIKYLIVDHEKDITDLITHLDFAKEKYDPETKRRLASRILTSDQIMNDF